MLNATKNVTTLYHVVVRRKDRILLERVASVGILIPVTLLKEHLSGDIDETDTPITLSGKLKVPAGCHAYPIATKYTKIAPEDSRYVIRHLIGVTADTDSAAEAIETTLSTGRNTTLEWATESELWENPGNFATLIDCIDG